MIITNGSVLWITKPNTKNVHTSILVQRIIPFVLKWSHCKWKPAARENHVNGWNSAEASTKLKLQKSQQNYHPFFLSIFQHFFSRTSNTFSVHFFLAASYSSLNLLFFSCFFPVSNVAFCESVVCIFFWYCGFVWQSRHRKHERERVRKKCRWLPV